MAYFWLPFEVRQQKQKRSVILGAWTVNLPPGQMMPPTVRPAGTPSSGGWMRHVDSRYGINPAIVPGATQKNTNDPSTAPTVLVTPRLPHHAFVFAERRVKRRRACAPSDFNAELGRSSNRLFNQQIRSKQHGPRDCQT